MSFIERAVEELQRQDKPADRPVEKERAMRPLPQDPVPPGERPAARPRTPAAAGTLQSMPCRSDRTVPLDRSALRRAGVVAPEGEERRLAEEYRLIKRPLLKAISGDGQGPARSNLVVITSAVPGEGKTFTSINLALSLAVERNLDVVLIDGDVAKRDVTRLFHLENELGLLDAGGAEQRELEDTILSTDVPSLYIMPAGSRHAEATEILASERMATLLGELAAEPRRVVIIDSPPLLVTSEAGVLAGLAGQLIVVVKASETPQEILLRAVETIAEDKPVSLILNQVLSVPERDYGYYGYYGDYGNDGKSAGQSTAAASNKNS